MYKVTRNALAVCRKLSRSDLLRPTLETHSKWLSTSTGTHGSLHRLRKNVRVPMANAAQKPWFSHNNMSRSLISVRNFASDSFPKHTKVPLPALSPTMDRGSIKSWEKKEGDKLSEGDLLATIETDKATMDFETPEEGYLAKILVPSGSKDVPLGQIVCVIVQNQEDVAAFKSYSAKDAGGDEKPVGKDASKDKPSEDEGQSKKKEKPAAKEESESSSSGKGSYPKHLKVNLPALSPTVDKSTIKSWGKKVGDEIREGDMIAQVETDKTTIDWNWENPEVVYVAKLFVPDGAVDVPVGQLVAIFVDSPDDVPAFKDMKADSAGAGKPPKKAAKSDDDEEEAPKKSGKSKSDDDAEKQPTRKSQKDEDHGSEKETAPTRRAEGERVFASPLARTLAKEKDIDISQVTGTGPDGRIIAEDVNKFQPGAAKVKTGEAQPKKARKAAAADSAEGTFLDIPMTNMRQVIANRLLQSKQTIPHYYLSVDVILDEVMDLRKELNEMLEKEKVKLSVNDFVIKASALACKKIPQANSSWMDTFIRQFNMVDVSVAVSTDAGLITPIIFSADTKGLVEINGDVVRLADLARKGKLKPQEFQGGTFTVSNLGMFGIKNFSAVINPPQSCILAVGGAQKQLISDETSKEGYRLANVMSVTLSCDHRVVDGAVGAQWLQSFKKLLEQPETMLL